MRKIQGASWVAWASALALGLLVAQVQARCGPDGTKGYPPGTTECPTGGGTGGGTGLTSGTSASGQASSALCSTADGTACAADGSSNEIVKNLQYDSATGKFSSTLVTNLCADHPYGGKTHTSECTEQSFPDPSFASGPSAAPLLGTVALSYSGGMNIYGPFEAGFTSGQVCTGGDCSAGVDVPLCEAELKYECTDEPDADMMPDTCGGHAMPYHYHMDLTCNYDATIDGVHSSLTGLALDGYGIYGKYEMQSANSISSVPQLDACGGHYGFVNGDFDENTGSAAHCVYHYHTQDDAPYTLGCYGPVNSLEECEALFPETCGTGYENITYIDPETQIATTTEYDLFCPCYKHETSINICDPDYPIEEVGELPLPLDELEYVGEDEELVEGELPLDYPIEEVGELPLDYPIEEVGELPEEDEFSDDEDDDVEDDAPTLEQVEAVKLAFKLMKKKVECVGC